MADNLTLPTQDIPIGKCPHCGAQILISEHWFIQLTRLLNALNGLI